MNLLSDWGKNDIHMLSDRIRVPGVPAVSFLNDDASILLFFQSEYTTNTLRTFIFINNTANKSLRGTKNTATKGFVN